LRVGGAGGKGEESVVGGRGFPSAIRREKKKGLLERELPKSDAPKINRNGVWGRKKKKKRGGGIVGNCTILELLIKTDGGKEERNMGKIVNLTAGGERWRKKRAKGLEHSTISPPCERKEELKQKKKVVFLEVGGVKSTGSSAYSTVRTGKSV